MITDEVAGWPDAAIHGALLDGFDEMPMAERQALVAELRARDPEPFLEQVRGRKRQLWEQLLAADSDYAERKLILKLRKRKGKSRIQRHVKERKAYNARRGLALKLGVAGIVLIVVSFFGAIEMARADVSKPLIVLALLPGYVLLGVAKHMGKTLPPPPEF